MTVSVSMIIILSLHSNWCSGRMKHLLVNVLDSQDTPPFSENGSEERGHDYQEEDYEEEDDDYEPPSIKEEDDYEPQSIKEEEDDYEPEPGSPNCPGLAHCGKTC